MTLIAKFLNKSRMYILKILNQRNFHRNIKSLFSSNLIDLLDYSYMLKLSESDASLISKIEDLRRRTRQEYKNDKVMTYSSPKTGEALFADDGTVQAGKVNYSTSGSFARTGTGPKTGIQLKKLAEAFDAKNIIELGTNTGISGCYFLSALNTPRLTTIEGSPQLASIARYNLSTISNNFEVITDMFDNALDQLIVAGKKYDLAFIDGQHEEQATLHYAEKLKKLMMPNGVILFDDIFWSEGMNRAWEKIKDDPDFDMIIGFRSRGLARFSQASRKIVFEITDYTGRPSYARKGH
ncbi:hypothetical protein LSUCC1028_03890 [Rhodobacterales bacterium LSUCC1028]|nr:hypothetical protein [Rhodobacterales bacterium LSUCC1028]